MISKAKFEEAYQAIVRESKPILEAHKQKAIQEASKEVVIVFGLILFGFFMYNTTKQAYWFMLITLSIMIYIIGTSFRKKPSAQQTYRREYKEKVVAKLLSYFDESLEYIPAGGIPSSIYYSAGFQTYDRYYAEDFIKGKINEKYPFGMSELLIQSESTDEDGHTTYTTEFRGLFSMIENSKNIHSTIYIKKNQRFGRKSNFRGEKLVPLDSPEFEKTFDIYSNSNIVTVQILTAEIMQMLNTMYQHMNYELTIMDNMIFMRFALKENLFEASYGKQVIKKEKLLYYCQIINFIMELFLKCAD